MLEALAIVLERAGCADRVEIAEVETGRVPAEVVLPHEILAPAAAPEPRTYEFLRDEPEAAPVAEEPPVVTTITDDGDGGSSAVNGDFEAVEWAIVEAVNAIRSDRGLAALTYDPRLQAGAIKHSVEMYQMEYFSHTSPVAAHANFATRINLEGISDFGVAGENLVMGPDARDLAKRFVDIWMDSPGHRANILGEDFRYTGVGVYGEGDRVYATQLFSQRVDRGPDA
ncbi:MAG: CAP domain-containing protein [Myxococcota bacterium]|nr:CAP domain-containing protein [Myxococcota bacterium]